MKKILFSCMVVACLAILSSVNVACDSGDKPTEFKIEKGMNIGKWLSQSFIRDERREKIFTDEDIKLLVDNGFDHIRLPVDEGQLFNRDMTLNEETARLMHNAIRKCIDSGLKVIFDMHGTRHNSFLASESPLFTDPEIQDKFVDMWRKIQDELRQYPVTDVAYEILNEAYTSNDETWSEFQFRVVNMLRETEKDRVIVLGANKQNHVEHIKNIRVPEGDRNIILSFHFYEPLLITHYQASWTVLRDLKFEGAMQYPGQLIPDEVYAKLTEEEKAIVEPYNQTYDKEWIRTMWSEAIAYAKEKGVQLYLGEFGCMPNCGEEMRLAWVKDVVDVARENKIAYTMWDWSEEFGFIHRGWPKGTIYNEPLLNVLVK